MSKAFSHLYEFGDFRLDPETSTVRRGGELIALPPKAFDLLRLLVEKKGELVSKQEILDTVWAETFVEEGVLTQNVYILRKTLGADRGGKQLIENIARRGYRLAIAVHPVAKEPSPAELVENEKKQSDDGAVDDSASGGVRRARFRNSLLLIGSAVVLFSLAAAFAYYFAPREAASAPESEMRFQRLTDTGDVAYLAISPDGAFVAFNRKKDIFLKDLQSNSEIKIDLDADERIGGLQFSADSGFIYFVSNPEPNAPGKVYRVSRLGGPAKIAADNVWSGVSFAPDGGRIAFHRKAPNENRWSLVLKDLATDEERELARKTLPEQYYWNNYPAWSTDGKRIAAVVVSLTEHFLRLVVIDLETGAEEEIKSPNFRNVEQVVWAADGKSLIASANDGNNFQLWRILYPDGRARRITNDLNSYLGLSITRDGKKLIARQRIYYSNIWVADDGRLDEMRQLTVGTSRNDGLRGLDWLDEENVVYASNAEKLRDWNLWLVNAKDGARRELTFDDERQNERPAAAPDGRTVYFGSNRLTAAHIWRVSVDGGQSQRVTSGEKETELYPQVSPDGAWLYFIRKQPDSSAVWRRSLIDGRTEKLTDEAVLSPDSFLSLSPDGKHLAFRNLAPKHQAGEDSENFRVGVISTTEPREARFFDVRTLRQLVRWRPGENAFDYVIDEPGGARIFRQPLDENARPALVLNLPKEGIFDFAWSKDGRRLAVARGQLLRDVVLLTGFGE